MCTSACVKDKVSERSSLSLPPKTWKSSKVRVAAGFPSLVYPVVVKGEMQSYMTGVCLCSEYDLDSSLCCMGWGYWTMDNMRGIQEGNVT